MVTATFSYFLHFTGQFLLNKTCSLKLISKVSNLNQKIYENFETSLQQPICTNKLNLLGIHFVKFCQKVFKL